MSGEQEFSGKVRAATNVAATRFTEVTITTPPLTRVLDRLIGGGGGISICGDGV